MGPGSLVGQSSAERVLLTRLRALIQQTAGNLQQEKRLSKANSSPQVKSTERSTTGSSGLLHTPGFDQVAQVVREISHGGARGDT